MIARYGSAAVLLNVTWEKISFRNRNFLNDKKNKEILFFQIFLSKSFSFIDLNIKEIFFSIETAEHSKEK